MIRLLTLVVTLLFPISVGLGQTPGPSSVDGPTEFVHPLVRLTLPAGWTISSPARRAAWFRPIAEFRDSAGNWLRLAHDDTRDHEGAFKILWKPSIPEFEESTVVEEKHAVTLESGLPALFGILGGKGIHRLRRVDFQEVIATIKAPEGALVLSATVPVDDTTKRFFEQVRQIHRSARPGDPQASTSGAELATLGPEAKNHPLAVTVPDEALRRAASSQSAEAWRLPLGRAYVERVMPVSAQRMLVMLRDEIEGLPAREWMVVDLASGSVVWRQPRTQKPSRHVTAEESAYVPLSFDRTSLVFAMMSREGGAAVCIDAGTGEQKWISDAFTRVVGAPGGGIVLGESFNPAKDGKGGLKVTALGLADGKDRWKREYRSSVKREIQSPLAADSDLILFFGPPERITSSGEVKWTRSDLALAPYGPNPAMVGGTVVFEDSEHRLVALDVATGGTVWSQPLEKTSSLLVLSSAGDVLFASSASNLPDRHAKKLQLIEQGREPAYTVTALEIASGKMLWQQTSAAPVMSEVLVESDRAIYATPTELVALESRTGKPVWRTKVTEVAEELPVRLVPYRDRVAFVGELAVVAVDANGRKAYGWTFAPLSADTEAHGFGEAQRSWKMGEPKKSMASVPEGGSQTERMRTLHSMLSAGQARVNRATSAYYLPTPGLYQGPMGTYYQAQAFANAIVVPIAQAVLQSITVPQYNRMQFIEGSILGSTALSISGDYVWRANVRGGLAYLDLVHLPTGERSERAMGPSYRNHGLWSVIDLERGVAYFQSVGLDPGKHLFAEPHSEYRFGQLFARDHIQYLESYLIAAPIQVPKGASK